MSEARSELLVFQVGARFYAAQVHDVRRVGSVRAGGLESGALAATVLGEPFQHGRGIVVDLGDQGDRALLVDQVVGVRSVPEEDLHPLPAFAAHCLASEAITGFAMVDEAPMVLVDLATLVREQLRRDDAAHPGERV